MDYNDFNEKVPAWNDEGTLTNEEKVLITQSVKEVGECMSNYVGIVRSDLRLKRSSCLIILGPSMHPGQKNRLK